MSSLPQLIRTNVQRNGDKIATRFKGRERTWHAVQDRVARLAAGLHSLDVGEGDRVAVLALNSDRYFEFYFGASWAGAVFVPVNNRLAPAEFVHWLNDSGSQVLFVDDNYLPAVAEIRDRLESVRHLVYMGDGDLPDGYLAYEALLNAQAPVAPSSARGRRHGRPVLHRRHHRQVQGRHAQPPQPDLQRAAGATLHTGHGGRRVPACRAHVSPGGWLLFHAGHHHGLHTCHRPQPSNPNWCSRPCRTRRSRPPCWYRP